MITNCDDDLFAASNRRLGVEFDWIVTAQQVGSYKPDEANFRAAFERLGLPRERIVHVAQSLFHDHVPAKHLGLTTVDRSAVRSPGIGGDPAGRCLTRCPLPGHGVVRRGRRPRVIVFSRTSADRLRSRPRGTRGTTLGER